MPRCSCSIPRQLYAVFISLVGPTAGAACLRKPFRLLPGWTKFLQHQLMFLLVDIAAFWAGVLSCNFVGCLVTLDARCFCWRIRWQSALLPGYFLLQKYRHLSGLREGGGLVDCGWHDRLYWRLYFDCTTAFHIQASVHRLSTVSGDSILYVRLWSVPDWGFWHTPKGRDCHLQRKDDSTTGR